MIDTDSARRFARRLTRPRGQRTTAADTLAPELSIVVIVYDMPRQALQTLYTLSREYQRDAGDVPYEVVVVENRSRHNLDEGKVKRLGPQFRYYRRAEQGVSPAPAVNFGISQCRSDRIGIMIDGARMVTPGVIRNVADAFRAWPSAVVAAPGFHLGHQDQQFSDEHGYDEKAEKRLLGELRWREDGYELYNAATVSGANPWGYLHPMMESNCMFATRAALERIGGADLRFDQPGGGVLNLDMYRELVELPDSQLVILPGEASFHQFHGGVTTQQDAQREQRMLEFRQRYEAIRGKPFHAPLREPVLFGSVHPYAAPFLHYSALEGRTRFERWSRRLDSRAPWDDDVVTISTEILDDPFDEAEQRRTAATPARSPQEPDPHSRAVPDHQGEEMSIYLPPSVRHFYPRHMVFSTWVDHIQFGYDLVEAVKPEMLVELGTQGGLSYFTFCQSVQEHDLSTLCYAVDTWEGEEHTGAYDESVFTMVNDYNRRNYPGFSYLLRMYFKEALDHFDEESIDLLHIDGLHTYEAVSEDFQSWYPKVKPGGVILFHDIKARMKDFGVWRFWDEIAPQYPTFTFNHGFGLGVLRKPGGEPSDAPLLQMLFDTTPGEQERLRQFYVHAAMFHDFRRKATGGN